MQNYYTPISSDSYEMHHDPKKNKTFRVGPYNIVLMFVFVLVLWALRISTQSNTDIEQNQLEIMSVQNKKGILVDQRSYESRRSALATEIESEVRLNPELKGFMVISTTDSSFIYPDLEHHMEFRVSQLAIFNGKAFASRKVLYRSETKPQVVIVMALDANWNTESLYTILEERIKYCELNEYGLYARYIQDFAAENRPLWESLGLAKIRLLRQSMLAFPDSEWFWYYDAHGHSMNPDKILSPLAGEHGKFLELAVDSPNFVSKMRPMTSSLYRIKIILSVQPEEPNNISSHSIMLKRSLPSLVFLELLSDPIMQNYEGFANSNDHAGDAMAHLVKCHPHIAQNVAIIPPE